jgi:hypothetical protein
MPKPLGSSNTSASAGAAVALGRKKEEWQSIEVDFQQ